MSSDALPGEGPPIEADRARIRELETRLEEAEQTLAAIREGDVDAVVVQGPDANRAIYTLEHSDQPYRVLIDLIREGALTLGQWGTVLYCNRPVADMLGVSQERIIGQELARFVEPAGRAGLSALLDRAMAEPASEEVVLQAGDGARVPIQFSLRRLSGDGNLPLLCGILTDLTEQKQQARALAEAGTRLTVESAERGRIEEALRQSQKMEAVGQLTGGVAHDFNNLLTVIKSSTDLLKRPDLPQERRVRYVEAISETVDRAAKLTGQLLAFARRQALKPEVFEVGARIRAVADMLDTVTGARIHVATQAPPEPCYVRADLSQFETALVNMAVNARDAMTGEGHLTLRLVARAPLPAIRGHAGSQEAFAAVMITDTGVGIAPDLLIRIFEPFFTTKEVGKGTGLGLSQVFGFAKQSGGDVDVASTVGRGTTFTLYLPEVEAPAPGSEPDAAPPGVVEETALCVLVVEDNVEVGRFATQILEDLGHHTVWMPNAEEALAELERIPFRFQAVFSDVVMPGMGGIALARELRRRLPDLPVVLTSGYSHVLAEEGAHEFELLRKPYSVEELSRVLRKAVATRPRRGTDPAGLGRG